MTNFFNQEIKEILSNLQTPETTGLTTEEVKRRFGEYGYNQLSTKRKRSFLKMYIAQFKSFMIIILLIAAAISGVVGVIEGKGLLDTFVILVILILNAFVGAFQERKAESSLEALKKLAAPETKVLRDGIITEIPTRELVPGDIVILETGEIIPADLRLIEAVNLKIQESALTIVTYGRGRGVVVTTGMQTEVGKIADLLQQTVDTETPMSKRLEQLGKVLGIAALIICTVIFIVGVLYGNSIITMFMTAVSLAVAAIPEGLPAVSTVVLAIGVQRMVKRNAIIRTLPSVETLGSATVICSDKTGTLTQNKMTVVEAYVNHKRDVINRAAPSVELNEEEERLLSISVLCADAQFSINEDGKYEFTGDHQNTAMAIADEIGIYREGDLAITGTDLEKLSEEELNENVIRYSVYARVAPEHKVRIVKAWQRHDEVVTMTGDGVNDAPALKQADIGAAMGIVGTDVVKGAADMVLTDDNFATIVSAVEEGRRIYDNILKAIQFLLSTNIGEIFLLLITSILNLGIPLLPIHILWVNLVTDSLPALALSVDSAEENIMSRKPRNSKKGFMTRGMVWRIMYQGIMIGTIPLVAYIIGLRDGGQILGQTMAFTTLMFVQLIHVRNLHSNTRSPLAISPLKNKPLIGAILASAGLALIVLLIPPVRNAFSLTAMDGKHWILVILMSLIPILVVDIFKLFGINTTKDEKNN